MPDYSRMQLLPQYKNCSECVQHIVKTEGVGALYRSLPTAVGFF